MESLLHDEMPVTVEIIKSIFHILKIFSEDNSVIEKMKWFSKVGTVEE